MKEYSLQLETLDRLEAVRTIIEMLLSGNATLDADTVAHLGHMLTTAAQKLAWARNEAFLFGDDRG